MSTAVVFGTVIEAGTGRYRGISDGGHWIIVRWTGGVLREYAGCVWANVGQRVALDGADSMQWIRPVRDGE